MQILTFKANWSLYEPPDVTLHTRDSAHTVYSLVYCDYSHNNNVLRFEN